MHIKNMTAAVKATRRLTRKLARNDKKAHVKKLAAGAEDADGNGDLGKYRAPRIFAVNKKRGAVPGSMKALPALQLEDGSIAANY